MTNAISQAYLDGIREGRSLLNAWLAEGLDDVAELARVSLANAQERCRMFDASTDIGQLTRGERDFWRNQIRKS